ncbi:hypothetical protein EH228_04495 [Erwinia endophytica]|uniref:hypothetical protein n=1 Tax=Erwinia endophytica TaxID=1563158 RepID=UPI001265DB9E|nr:hypothetical protein [Erwinia endophytica]KAB8312942.1 hypothetical protein EH228_04495 [Erwinia endophytica]
MTKSEIFKTAHEIAKSTNAVVGCYQIAFSLALKSVYASLTQTMEEKLIDMGMHVWEKGDYRRIYIKAEHYEAVFGLKTQHYKTGNIKSAMLNGQEISNSKAYKLCSTASYFDCNTQQFVSNMTPII